MVIEKSELYTQIKDNWGANEGGDLQEGVEGCGRPLRMLQWAASAIAGSHRTLG